jgi:cytochrome b
MSAQTSVAQSPVRARIWDIPTRVVHWAFVALIPAMWWTAENHEMAWHRRAGYLMLGLLLFRLLLGFFGSSTARFSNFLRSPMNVIRYARGDDTVHRRLGHNPLGGWSVAAMLFLLTAQIGLGLFATDVDGLQSGPMATHLSFDAARDVADIHGLIFNLLLGAIALHIGAVVFYLVAKRQNLIGSMLHGRAHPQAEGEPMTPAALWRSALAAGLAGIATYWISTGGSF